METSSQSRVSGGLWNNPRAPQYSKETQDMLKLMMQESKLTNLQRKQINKCLQNGEALPLTFNPTPSASRPHPKTRKPVQACLLPGRPQRRSADACRSGDSYIREKFFPGPTRDLEKEKRRLQCILATGQEEPTAASSKHDACLNPEVTEERDRCQEVLDQIEERRQFLADMASLGQEKKYINIINTEISQKLRDLEVLEKARGAEKAVTSDRKVESAEPVTERVKKSDARGLSDA